MQPSLKNLLSISSLDLTQSHFSGPKGNLGRTPLLPQKFFNFSLLMVNLPLQEVFFHAQKVVNLMWISFSSNNFWMPPLRTQKHCQKRYTLSHPKERENKFWSHCEPGEPQSSSVFWGEFVDVAGVFFSSKFSLINGLRYTSHLCHPCLWKIDLLLNPAADFGTVEPVWFW